ncbi:MAG: VOC family protein [Thermomicrobiales bacterium]
MPDRAIPVQLPIAGLHHVTAIAANAQRNLDFYVGVLGLRLVKQTVNGADPDQLHLFYGNRTGGPGSVITFFVWPDGNPAQHGVGEVAVTSFAIGPHSLGFWIERLVQRGIPFEGPTTRQIGSGSTEYLLSLRDPDGLMLELVVSPTASPPDAASELGEHAIRGLHSVTLWVDRLDQVAPLLTSTLGFVPDGVDGTTHRFVLGEGGSGRIVDVRAIGGFVDARPGTGGVDHVAWAVEGNSLGELDVNLAANRVAVGGVVDRHYFTSIYARDGSEILHEFATTEPGFTVDEDLDTLGITLTLPAEWESERETIVAKLPHFVVPGAIPSTSWFAHLANEDGDPSSERYAPYDYVYEGGSDGSSVLLLLHGTGGNERSLLPLTAAIAPGVATISPRGKVKEGNALRFFRRFAEGDLDQDDLRFRTREMNAFVREAIRKHDLTDRTLVALGFSNGANLAASMLLRGDSPLDAAILLSPMLPFVPDNAPVLNGVGIFIGAGLHDPLVPFAQVEELATILERAGADVTLISFDGGHTVTPVELEAARAWLAER